MSQRARSATAMPLADLIDTYGRSPRSKRGSAFAREHTLQVITQLGVPPDLRYLRDGFERTLKCIDAFGSVLDGCLRMVPGALSAAEFAAELGTLLIWIDSQGWQATDPRLAKMARAASDAPHPLDGYALSVCHHWSNLFYTVAPTAAAASPGDAAQAYEALVQEFSMYVLAAQSQVEPGRYLAYCREWHVTSEQPHQTFYPSSRLASRVADASRAVRRLSLAPSGAMFTALADPAHGSTLADRVVAARQRHWSGNLQQVLDAIDRLLEEVVPGWRRPASSGSAGGSPRHAPQHMLRRTFHDGYVRVSESPCIALIRETDLGARMETTVQRPATVEEVTAELLVTPGPVDQDGRVEATPSSEENARGEAREAAEAQLDGQEWLPQDEAAPAGAIEALVLPEGESEGLARPGVRPGTASRWAADWLRRMHMAHPLVPGRLELDQVRGLLRAMADPKKVEPENAAAAACMHAAIALGRSLEAGCTLKIHTSLQRATLEPDRIHYGLAERQWVVFAPPPAWRETPAAECERALWPQVRLIDRTSFWRLLEAHGLAHPGVPVRRLTEVRRDELLRWTGDHLPRIAAPADACRDFLFHRLLAVTRGDLGIARLITGRELAHSATVAHYAYYRTETVWNAYRRSWQEDASAPAAAAETGPVAEVAASTIRHGYGARRVPEVGAVRQLVEWLRERVRRSAGAERHNLYTAYTWVGLVLGTAMRPVTTIVLHDPVSGMGRFPVMTFVDKARSDYHRRITALPAALAEHLDRYAHYLRALDLEMRGTGAAGGAHALPFRYCDEDSAGGDSPKGGKQEKDRQADRRWRAFRPSDFQHLCGAVFGLELYALRRFVRTELAQDEGLTAEDVDAWMGHWFDGLSPVDRLSTYPMGRLQEIAGGAAARLLAKTSFKALWIDQRWGLRS